MFWFKLKKLIGIVSSRTLLSALLKGAAAGVEHGPMLHTLDCECVVDVGANRGQFALISRQAFPHAAIHSFEPLDEPARIFRDVFRNDSAVTLHPVAIGREKSTATIHVTREDDSSSMLPVNGEQAAAFPGAVEMETRQVTVLPLSQALDGVCLPPSSLLKIDVQGFELEVLMGSEDILQSFSHLYIECSFVDLYAGQALAYQVIDWLGARNFFLEGVYNLYYAGRGHSRAVQGDFLFVRGSSSLN